MAYTYGAENNTNGQNPLLDSTGLQTVLNDVALKRKNAVDTLENQIQTLSQSLGDRVGTLEVRVGETETENGTIGTTINSLVRKPINQGGNPIDGTNGQTLVSNGNGGTRWIDTPDHTINGLSVSTPQSHGSQIGTITATRFGEESVDLPIYGPAAVQNPNALTIQMDDSTQVVYDGSQPSTVDMRTLTQNVVRISDSVNTMQTQIGNTTSDLLFQLNKGTMTFNGVNPLNIRVFDMRLILSADDWEYESEDVYSQTLDQERTSTGVQQAIDISFDQNTRFMVDVDLMNDDESEAIGTDFIVTMLEDYSMIHRAESLTPTQSGGRIRFWCYHNHPQHDVAVRIRWIRLDQEDV